MVVAVYDWNSLTTRELIYLHIYVSQVVSPIVFLDVGIFAKFNCFYQLFVLPQTESCLDALI